MGNFLINQKIKKIKEIKDFDSFDYLINWDGVHTSYLNQGQRSTDKYFWKLIIIYTNGYNSISCFGWTLRSKIRGKLKNQRKSKSLILLIIWFFSRLCIWAKLSLLFLIHCGIDTTQEMELLPCDLTPCHLCQFFTNIRWGRMYG